MKSGVSQVTRRHVKEEENVYLPKLAAKVGPAGMQDLAQQFEAAKMAAPTRCAKS